MIKNLVKFLGTQSIPDCPESVLKFKIFAPEDVFITVFGVLYYFNMADMSICFFVMQD